MPDQAITKVKNQKEEYIMNNRYKRVLAAVLSIVMLMTVTLSVSVFAENAAAGISVKQDNANAADGYAFLTKVTFDKALAAVAEGQDPVDVYGDHVILNDVTLRISKARGSAFIVKVDADGKTLNIYSNNSNWTHEFVPDYLNDHEQTTLGTYENYNNKVELLPGLPFADGSKLVNRVTATAAKDSGYDWKVAVAEAKTGTKASVKAKQLDMAGSYFVTELTFDKELVAPTAKTESANGKTLIDIYGDYLRLNEVTVRTANAWGSVAGKGGVYLELAEDGKTLKVYSDNCSWVNNIILGHASAVLGTHEGNANVIDVLPGFPFADGTALSGDIKVAMKANSGYDWQATGDGLDTSVVNVSVKQDNANAADGYAFLTKVTFDKALAAVAEGQDPVDVYGDHVILNDVTLRISKARGSAFIVKVDADGKTLNIYSNNSNWTHEFVPDYLNDHEQTTLGTYENYNNKVELLPGLPFADGSKLVNRVTATAAKDSGYDWKVAVAEAKTGTKASVKAKQLDMAGSYFVTELTFDKELVAPTAKTESANGKTLIDIYGDYLRLNEVTVRTANAWGSVAGKGGVYLELAEDGKTLKVYSDNCSWVNNIILGHASAVLGTHEGNANVIDVLPGFPFADGTALSGDIKVAMKANSGYDWQASGDGLKPSTEPDPEPKPDDRPAATTDDLVTGVARDQSGSYGVADLFFGKVLKSGDVSANYGDYVKVNGVLLKTGMAYKNPTYLIESIKAFANDNLLQIQTSNCDMANAIDPSLPSGRVVFFSENQDNTIELLAGFPFADGTVLDRNITLTMAKHKSGERGVWTVSDAGGSLKPDFDAKDWTAVDPGDVDNTFDRDAVQDPNVGQKLTMEMLPITVTVDGKEYTTPFLPANLGGYYMENGGYYSGVRIKFNRPLMYKDGDTLLKLMGDKMKIGAKAVDAALSESSRNMDGNGDFVKATLSDDKCELLLLYRWDKISGPWLYTQDGTVNPTEDKSKWQTNGGQADCSVTLLEGIAYGKGDEVTDYTLRAAFSGGTWSWTVENSGDEPDLTGEKVTVFITNADGVPGITDPVAGQSWLSQVKIVFSHKLYTDDVSEAALIAKYGKYITLNSATVAALYEQNNPGTGVPHAVTLELVDGGKALLVKCDVTMANSGALVSTSDQLILLDKDFPITSKKTLEEEWAFEYTVESGDWVRLTDDKPDDGKKDDDGKQDDGKTDDGKTDDTPKTGVAGVSAAVLVLTAICGVTVMVTRRKNNA